MKKSFRIFTFCAQYQCGRSGRELGCWERLKAGGKGTTEDEMVGWHHGLNGHEFKHALRVGDRQGGLACCSPWDHKELDMTE